MCLIVVVVVVFIVDDKTELARNKNVCVCVSEVCVFKKSASSCMDEWTDESAGVFARVCVCARMCVSVGCKSFFLLLGNFPNDEGGAPYMEMGILLFLFCFEL